MENEILILLASKLDMCKKELGNYAGSLAEKSVLIGFTLQGHADFTKCSNTCDSECSHNVVGM